MLDTHISDVTVLSATLSVVDFHKPTFVASTAGYVPCLFQICQFENLQIKDVK